MRCNSVVYCYTLLNMMDCSS